MPVKTTVTGVVQDPSGDVATSGYVEFRISPQGSSQPYRVSGTSVIAPMTVQAVIDSNGQIKAVDGVSTLELWGNDLLQPANSSYQVLFAPNDVIAQSVNGYLISGATYDLSNPVFQPPFTLNPATTPLRGEATEGNLFPLTTDVFSVGAASRRYAEGHFAELFADNLNLVNPVSSDSIAVVGYLESNLPVKGVGVMARVTDKTRGIWKSLGAGEWASLYPCIVAAECPGATASAKINAAALSLAAVSTGGTIDARGIRGGTWNSSVTNGVHTRLLLGAGLYVITTNAFTWSAGSLFVEGQSMFDTQLSMTGAGNWNFNPSYSTSGIGFCDLTLTSTSTTVSAITIGHASATPAWVDVHNVICTGPGGGGGGTAHGINIVACAVSLFDFVWVYDYPGDCWHVNGDNGAENHFRTISGDSAGGWNFYLERLTTAQVGGWYLETSCIFSNIDNITTNKGIAVVGPNGTQAQLNFNLFDSAVDKTLGGPCLLLKNTQHVKISGNQFDNQAAAGANHAGVQLFNVTEGIIDSNTIASSSRCVTLEDTTYYLQIDHNNLTGNQTNTVGIYVVPGLVGGWVDIRDNTSIGGSFSLQALTNSPSILFAMNSAFLNDLPERFGSYVQGTMRLSALTGVTPNKDMKVVSGVMQWIADDGSTVIMQLGDDGSLFIPTKLNQYVSNEWNTRVTIPTGATTATFIFPSGGYSFEPEIYITSRGNLGGRDIWITSNAFQATVNISSSLGSDLDVSLLVVGNPY